MDGKGQERLAWIGVTGAFGGYTGGAKLHVRYIQDGYEHIECIMNTRHFKKFKNSLASVPVQLSIASLAT
jgi:hypothetical protein